MAKWQGYADNKKVDKGHKKAAEVAQAWLKRGFTPKQVADAIYNKVGYECTAKDDQVLILGCYANEKRIDLRVFHTVTADQIIKAS